MALLLLASGKVQLQCLVPAGGAGPVPAQGHLGEEAFGLVSCVRERDNRVAADRISRRSALCWTTKLLVPPCETRQPKFWRAYPDAFSAPLSEEAAHAHLYL